MDGPIMCLTSDDVIDKTKLAITGATETLDAFNFSETLVQREIHLVRLQVDIQLNKLENRAQLILQDLVRKENRRLEDILNQLYDILDSLKSPTKISKDAKENQQYLINTVSAISQLAASSQRQKAKFKENTEIAKAFKNLESFGEFFIVPVPSKQKSRTDKTNKVCTTPSNFEMCSPGLRNDTLRQTSEVVASTNKGDAKSENQGNTSVKEYNPFTVLRALNKVKLASFDTVNENRCNKTPDANDVHIHTWSNSNSRQISTDNEDKRSVSNDKNSSTKDTGTQNENIRERRLRKHDRSFLLKRSRSASPRSARSNQINGILKVHKAVPDLDTRSDSSRESDFESNNLMDDNMSREQLYKSFSKGKCVTFDLEEDNDGYQSQRERARHGSGSRGNYDYSYSKVNDNYDKTTHKLQHGRNTSDSDSRIPVSTNSTYKTDRSTRMSNSKNVDHEGMTSVESSCHSKSNVVDRRSALKQKRLRNRSINIPLVLTHDNLKDVEIRDHVDADDKTATKDTRTESQCVGKTMSNDEDSFKHDMKDGLSNNDILDSSNCLKQSSPLSNRSNTVVESRSNINNTNQLYSLQVGDSDIAYNTRIVESTTRDNTEFNGSESEERDLLNKRRYDLQQKRLRNRSITIPWAKLNDTPIGTDINSSENVADATNGYRHIDSNENKQLNMCDREHHQSIFETSIPNNTVKDKRLTLNEKRRRNRSINIPWARVQDKPLEEKTNSSWENNSNDIGDTKPWRNVNVHSVNYRPNHFNQVLDTNSLQSVHSVYQTNTPTVSETDSGYDDPGDLDMSPFVSQLCTVDRNRRQIQSPCNQSAHASYINISRDKPKTPSAQSDNLSGICGHLDEIRDLTTRKTKLQAPLSLFRTHNPDISKNTNATPDNTGSNRDDTLKQKHDTLETTTHLYPRGSNRRNMDHSARLRLPSFDEMLFHDKSEQN